MLLFFYFYPFFFLFLYYTLTLKFCVRVFSGFFKARIVKLGTLMANELLYCVVGLRIKLFAFILPFIALTLLFIYSVFFVFVFRLLKICVTVFFATHLFVAFCL